MLPAIIVVMLIKDWITALFLEPPSNSMVLAFAASAIFFMLVICLAIWWASRSVANEIDRLHDERNRRKTSSATITDSWKTPNDSPDSARGNGTCKTTAGLSPTAG